MKLKDMKSGGSVVLTVVIVIVVVLLLFIAGGIKFSFGEESFNIHATVWKGLSVRYDEIERAELRDDVKAGTRTMGYGSFKLSLGKFSNAEFGGYTLYAYTKCKTRVCMYLNDGSVVVVGGRDAAETQNIYDSINRHLQRQGE